MDLSEKETREKYFEDAIKLLKDNCPQKRCEWCEGR